MLGQGTKVGARRSTFATPPVIDAALSVESFVTREAITVVVSERGWIRAIRGKVEDPSTLAFKEGDKLAFLVACETIDKLMVFAADGRFFTLAATSCRRAGATASRCA